MPAHKEYSSSNPNQPELPFDDATAEAVVEYLDHARREREAKDYARAHPVEARAALDLQEAIEEHYFDEELDCQADKLGSYYDARIRVGLEEPDSISTELPLIHSSIQRVRSLNRRGGRAYPEPSDSDLDPEWQISERPDARQQAINQQGIREARKLVRESQEASEDARIASITDPTERDAAMRLARLRRVAHRQTKKQA